MWAMGMEGNEYLKKKGGEGVLHFFLLVMVVVLCREWQRDNNAQCAGMCVD